MTQESPKSQLPDSPPKDLILCSDLIGALAPVTIRQPPGTYALTPASRITLKAIAEHQDLFRGVGIDWGCGTGCLAIVAARIPAVALAIGLDDSELDVRVATENAAANGVESRTIFLHSDSYRPRTPAGCESLAALRGKVGFILANPPASSGDDGFSYRREVMAGAGEFLCDGGVVLVQISSQYSPMRIELLARGTTGFTYVECLATTPWVRFEQERPDLRQYVIDYAAEERRGGLRYTFGDPRDGGDTMIDARTALDLFQETGLNPLSRWQVHLFRYRRPDDS